jgi:hypothetical protein
MAAETITSAVLTNVVAYKPNDLRTAGRNFQKRAICTATINKTSPSYYGFFRVPANAVLVSAELSCDALSTSVTADIGFWEVSNPFAPVTTAGSVSNSSQYLGAAVSLVAAQTKTQILIQSGWTTRAKMDQMIWQILGLTADPQREYDVVATSDATITAGGVIVLEISYKLQ